MDYPEFLQEIQKGIRAYLPERYQDYKIEIHPSRKNNGVILDGLIIQGKERIVPVIYLNDFFKQAENGADLSSVMKEIADLYENRRGTAPEFSEEIYQYDKVREHLIVTVCNAEKNRGLLKTVPHESREDLALTYRIKRAGEPERGMESILVKNSMLKYWGIEEQELREDAWNSMNRESPASFRSMEDVLREVFSKQAAANPNLEPELMMEAVPPLPLYVLTNAEGIWGAAYMFDREIMAGIAETLGQDLLILPSSVHETLIIPEEPDMDMENYLDLVRTVNAMELDPEDILSDQIYRFDRKKQETSLVVLPGQAQGMGMKM
nr:DUF5688 family protein [uncultured Eisenbergiella sp.]